MRASSVPQTDETTIGTRTAPVHGDPATAEPAGGQEKLLAVSVARIELLGRFRVEIGSRSVDDGEWRLKRAALLVKLLALAPHHSLHREQAIDALWPELAPEAARNNLHQALHLARRILAVPEVLRLRKDQITLLPAGRIWTDVEAFEAAAASARQLQSVAAYRSALGLYRGDLLPSDLYEENFEARRTALRELKISLLLELGALHEGAVQPAAVEDALRQVLEIEPACEDAHVRLMRLYARAGRRQQALRQYEQLRAALRDEVDTEPAAGTLQLYRDILAGDVPATISSEAEIPGPAGGHNLPAALTSFVGRASEIAEVRRLQGESRLVTLLGPGGAGKTRLAVEAARTVVDRYRDGVYLVELASTADERLVPETVAAALGIVEHSDRSASASLVEALAGRHRLLILDNCEHVIGACAELAHDLLRACPELRILATSREALGTPGEVTAILPSLSLPPQHPPASVESLLEFDSVRLFVERARNRQQSFALTLENYLSVARICRQVEGMPLAIELAAARIGALSAGQIAARLDDALSLLTAGSRTAEPRHQTLRGAIDWSYELLDGVERALFARLAVFVGGWTLPAAEALGERDQDVLDVLSRLVDKSLVAAQRSSDDEIRYRMLEPIRQYALERLEQCSDVDDIRRRHAALFLALAEEAEPQLIKADQAAWMERLEAEHDNLRAALQWCLHTDRDETAIRLAASIWRFWYTRGHLHEARGWLRRLLAQTDPTNIQPELWVKGLGAAAALAFYQSDFQEAGKYWEQCVAASRARGDKRGLGRYLGNLGLVLKERGEYDQAVALYEESRIINAEIGNIRGVSSALGNLGIIALDRQEYDRARALQEESLAIKRSVEDDGGVITSLNNLAAIFVEQGEYQRAQELSREALVLARRLGLKRSMFVAQLNLGFSALHQGRLQEAAGLFGESLTLARATGEAVGIRQGLAAFAALAAARGQGEPAALLSAAADAVRSAGSIVLSPSDRAAHEHTVTIARKLLGDSVFDASSDEGRRMPVEHAIACALSQRDAEPSREIDAALTGRQREIAALVARGDSNVQIARQLGISERTATTHVSNILNRLGLASRTQLAAWVAEGGTS
jgi:predicted ATPase/DNA-binding SARP family transcriptional activator/DNA-binding CsgD family transcriptional regulator